jgi:murein DD-endopeptidase MepM/ murein hydrolase activator NlpD
MPWKKKILRSVIWLAGSVCVALIYVTIFKSLYGSPKEKILMQEIESLKLQYSLIGRKIDDSQASLSSLRLSDDIRYRPVLDMDTIAESFRKGGFGGVDRFSDLKGYLNSDLLISSREKIELLKNRSKVQIESFKSVTERTAEWKREMDHFPGISPVNVNFRLGEGYKFRIKHPVLGISRWHYGQDFRVPYGTDIYATGDGKVIESGWNSGGFGNYIVIDHGYGLRSTYGHLSEIRVSKGMSVRRCDLIGLSGSTGTSSGPHLHYEINQFGKHKNPIYFFNNDMSEEEFNEMIQAFGSKSKFR